MFHPRLISLSNKEFLQMKSETQQPPFYFGGSQVPATLERMSGKGFRDESELNKKHYTGKYRTLNTTKS